MTHINSLKLSLCAGVALLLAACATSSTPTTTAVASTTKAAAVETETTKDVADELSAAKNVSKSADGEMICKRTSVVGTNFKRKVCATKEQWEASAAESRRTTGSIQRDGGAPGTGN